MFIAGFVVLCNSVSRKSLTCSFPHRPPDFPLGLVCSALFPTSQMFTKHKEDLFKLLTPGSHMYEYMASYVFDPR